MAGRKPEEILFSDIDPVSKVQQVIRLGFGSNVADKIVERHSIAQETPTHYDQMDFDNLTGKEGNEM
jgi:hypothetical protein